jgi:hypothetical protein
MIKLKNILSEGLAWERKEGKGLPTLAEVQAEYNAKQLKEYSGDIFDEIADELGISADAFDNALNSSKAELDIIEKIYMSDSYTRTESLSMIADMLDIDINESIEEAQEEAQDKVSSRTHVVYACNVELADGTIKPGVRISVPKGDNAEQQVRDKIQDRFGKDSKIRAIAKAQNPHINDNDKEDEPRWQDNDGDGKWYEKGDDVKENVNESFVSRLKKNFIGGATRK